MLIRVILLLLCASAVQFFRVTASFADDRPNVLFIAVDDLNDWVSVFGGHPQAKTPNIDRLANSGSIVFQNAHCPGPVCGPCRSALLSGFMPHRSGVYGNSHNMLKSPLVQAHATLPEYFAKHGYATISRGKIFHAHAAAGGKDRGQWAFERWDAGSGGTPIDRKQVTSRDKNLIRGKPGPESAYTQGNGSEFAWGPTVGTTNEMSDFKTAQWAVDELSKPNDKPLFLAVGFSKPHLPFYCPQEFFDQHPIDDVRTNPIRENDLDDILTPRGTPKFKPSNDYLWIGENGLLKEATQAYLACVSFADACVGEVLSGLAKSSRADNTIVVLWGDHGWHLGEKLRYRKATGWSEATRLPLIIRTPDMTTRADCDHPVNLIDLYPTLIDYCGLPAKEMIDGKSLVPLLKQSDSPWDEATVTITGEGSASVCSKDWRYIRYQEGTEELYDLRSDPQEWTNLIAKMTPESEAAKARLSTFFPAEFAPMIEKSDASLKKAATKMDTSLNDQIIYGLAFGIGIGAAVFLVAEEGKEPSDEVVMLWIAIAVGFVLIPAILNAFLITKSGQTLGKKAAGTRIVQDPTRQLPGFVKGVVIRSFVTTLLAQFVPFFGLVDIAMIFGQERKCLHDKMAGTIVIDA